MAPVRYNTVNFLAGSSVDFRNDTALVDGDPGELNIDDFGEDGGVPSSLSETELLFSSVGFKKTAFAPELCDVAGWFAVTIHCEPLVDFGIAVVVLIVADFF